MRKWLILAVILNLYAMVDRGYGQTYTSYFTGSPEDLVSKPLGGVCMMGGATEHDEAMRWFLRRANGGDILVLRASGSNGYNDYLYSELGVPVNSVESIVFNDPAASGEAYIHTRIKQAEAIWFAGGDQWNYVSYWRNTPVDSLINDAMRNRNIVIGGTSAGMAILGKYYFSAQYGTVTSATALNNPYNPHVTVDSTRFLDVEFLGDVVTDTHYADREREGRHVVFLARILTDYGVAARGIACNAYTAVCIDENGKARVYGDYPNYPETTFFLQTNCGLEDMRPGTCTPAVPLDWNLGGEAIKVYKVHGTNEGSNYFDLSDWQSGEGGSWEHWYVENGILTQNPGTPVNCPTVAVERQQIILPVSSELRSVRPNPFNSATQIIYHLGTPGEVRLTVYDLLGRRMATMADGFKQTGTHRSRFDGSRLPSGTYLLRLQIDGIDVAGQKLFLVK